LVACVLTGFYVHWANTQYDSLIQKLNARLAQKQALEANEIAGGEGASSL
jgi:hypothetical protein